MDAVFAANDQMALGVMQFACRNAIRVPEDLGVVGFDDIAEGVKGGEWQNKIRGRKKKCLLSDWRF